MYRNLMCSVAACGLLSVGPVAAQDEMPPDIYVYATYYECDPALEGDFDAVQEAVNQPVLEAMVEEGSLVGYGYWRHHTGGNWRRLNALIGTSPEGLMENLAEFQRRTSEADAGDLEAGPGVCPRHDDYIWHVEASGGTTGEGDIVLSQYLICDESRSDETRAMIETQLAPVYNGFVEEGRLSSWTWLSHVVGGEFRNVLSFAAPTDAAVLGAFGAGWNATSEMEEMAAWPEICHSHDDYMWFTD